MSSPAAHTAHHAPTSFIRKYVFSLDHKVIGIQYYFLALFSVFVGMALSLLMRFHMVYPDAKVAWFEKLWPTGAAGGMMTPELYLSLMTMHGTIMVFFVLTTAPQSGFGNYFLPIQIGAEDMAFPVLNMLSFWTTFVALVRDGGGVLRRRAARRSRGWTAYPPLSALGAIAGPGEGMGQTLWIISIAIFCGASLMGAINFIATTVDLRAQGHDADAHAADLLDLARHRHPRPARLRGAAGGRHPAAARPHRRHQLLHSRRPADQRSDHQNHKGGSPLLWQHLFWFFGHPEVYIAILPGMGVTSQLLADVRAQADLRLPGDGVRHPGDRLPRLPGVGPPHVHERHEPLLGDGVFASSPCASACPRRSRRSTGSARCGAARSASPRAMLFALGFVSLFVTGGISGIFLGQPALDLYFHDTYFVVGHFHMIMGVAAIFGMFAGTFYWFPKMFGRMMNETLGKIHFYLHVHRRLRDLHADALPGHRRQSAALRGFHERRVPGRR